MRTVITKDATKREIDWAITKEQMRPDTDKRWCVAAVLSGERADPYTRDPLWMVPIIEEYRIATMPKRKGDVWIWSACLIDEDNIYHWADGESLIEAAARVYVHYLHRDTFEVPEGLTP